MLPARHRRAALVLLALSAGPAAAQNAVDPVGTVSDAVFRANWVGPQADRAQLVGLVPTSEGIKPVEDMATKLREGLWLGSMRIRPGFGAGWSYSNRNSQGQTTSTVNNDQSFFLSPSLGLEYGRDTGPWSLSARAAGGYVYYLNPDYTPNGTGTGRNPFNATMSLGLGHTGTRHRFDLSGSGSLGNGQNVQGGGSSTQFQGGARANYNYLLNEFVSTGAYANYSAQLTRYDTGGLTGANLTSLSGGGYVDWLCTGKTTLGLAVEAGRTTQAFPGSAAPSPSFATTGDISRQYWQVMVPVAHSLTSKILLSASAGVNYTDNSNVYASSSRYTGLRPAYSLSAAYDPSEKTTLRAYTSFAGFDVEPSYGLGLTWRARETTAFTLSVYQTQNFSITTAEQFQVSRGFTAGVEQRVFSQLSVSLSGGWQLTDNISLSDDIPDGGNYNYAFVNAGLRWTINAWSYWQASVMSSTGNRVNPGSNTNFPQTTASVGFNLLF